MGIFDKIKAIFAGGQKVLDVESRFERKRSAVTGTMSNFLVVRDIKENRIVGLKLLDVEKFNLFESRFKGLQKPSEGEIGMRLKHPQIVETYEYGFTTKGQPYVLMEYVDGVGLQQLIQVADEERIKPHRLKLVRQMAEAIAFVHKSGFIHRDICPRNFIVSEDLQRIKLIDFGLTVPAEPAFMQPGNRTGTPLYMAPEIVRRRGTDQRVDVFAFGVSVYSLYAFDFPWPVTETSGLAALKHDTAPPRDLQTLKPKLDSVLCKAIMRCVEPDPQKRTPSMDDFLKSIRMVSSDFSD
jgi:serine/threonine-protein kinase